jgi:hypothetical protein
MKTLLLQNKLLFSLIILSLSLTPLFGCQKIFNQNGHFEPAGKMCHQYRSLKTVLLENGDVFIYGRKAASVSTVSKPIAVAEIYHTKTHEFECLPSPKVSQESTSDVDVVLLHNGDVLISGGDSGLSKPFQVDDIYVNTGLAAAQLYHYKTKTFERIHDMSVSRVGHQSVLLPNGKVLLLSGRNTRGPLGIIKNSVSKTAELYDEQSKTFTPVNGHLCYPDSQAAILLADGNVLIVNSKNAELYNYSSNTFICLPDFFRHGKGSSLIRLKNGNVVTFPMRMYEKTFPQIFNPRNKQFATLSSPIPKRDTIGTISLLNDGRIFFTGGRKAIGSIGYLTSTTFFYDPEAQKFLPGPDMISQREGHQATVLKDGRVLLLGGDTGLFCCKNATEPELFVPNN